MIALEEARTYWLLLLHYTLLCIEAALSIRFQISFTVMEVRCQVRAADIEVRALNGSQASLVKKSSFLIIRLPLTAIELWRRVDEFLSWT